MPDAVVEEVQRWGRELRKGSVRLALLLLLRDQERYGYEILAALRERVSQGATEATVYPTLHDLEARGFLRSRWKEGQNGTPARKYYRITSSGEELLDAFRKTWKSYRTEMESVMS